MKKISHLLLFVLVFTNLQAQTERPLIPASRETITNPRAILIQKQTLRRDIPHHLTSTCIYDSITDYGYNPYHGFSRILQNKTNMYYNSSGKETNSFEWAWDSTTKTWIISGRDTSTYNLNNQNTSQTGQQWDTTTKTWVNSDRDTSTYNINNQITSLLWQTWDTTTKAWINSQQNLYTYDTKKNLLTEVNRTWYNAMWLNMGKDSFSYYANNNVESEIGLLWDSTTTTWNISGQSYYTYTSYDSLASESGKEWTGSAWINYDSIYYTYNTNHYLVNSVYGQWYDTSWLQHEQAVYTYNFLNDIASVKHMLWESSSWQNFDSNAYAYSSNNVDTAYHNWQWNIGDSTWQPGPYGYAALCGNNLCYTTTTNYNWPEDYYVFYLPIWLNVGENDSAVYYGCSVSGIEPIANKVTELNIYPNPSNGVFTIEQSAEKQSGVIEIYNMLGEKIYQHSFSAPRFTLNITDQPAGMYFVQLITDKGAQTVKFIKQ